MHDHALASPKSGYFEKQPSTFVYSIRTLFFLLTCLVTTCFVNPFDSLAHPKLTLIELNFPRSFHHIVGTIVEKYLASEVYIFYMFYIEVSQDTKRNIKPYSYLVGNYVFFLYSRPLLQLYFFLESRVLSVLV